MRSLRKVLLLLGTGAAVLTALRRRAGRPRVEPSPRPRPVPVREPAAAPELVVAAAPPGPPPRKLLHVPEVDVPAPPPRERRTPLVLLGSIALAAAGLAVAIAVTRDDAPAGPEVERVTTAAVLGTQASETTSAAVAALAPATASTPLRARGRALLPVPDARLGELLGARARGRVVRVDEVVGNRVFWVGTRAERMLVHLQGPGTRWAVRRGQRVSFTGVVTRTPRRAPERWGVDPEEGRQRLVRQGHHLEVWGPDMRFDCVARCAGVS